MQRTERAYLEKRVGGALVDCAVQDLGLLREIVRRLNGRDHSLDGEEGGEVCRVRRDDDEREEPPPVSYTHLTLPTILRV